MSELYASRSIGEPYLCHYPWACYVQCGDHGVVLANPSYTTAFFEAFPLAPATFIRGEGPTVGEAEAQAWQRWQRILACPEHTFVRGVYTSGAGVCTRCGLFQGAVFPPAFTCSVCGVATDYTSDLAGRYYCEGCQKQKPLDQWTHIDWETAYLWHELESSRAWGLLEGGQDGSLCGDD